MYLFVFSETLTNFPSSEFLHTEASLLHSRRLYIYRTLLLSRIPGTLSVMAMEDSKSGVKRGFQHPPMYSFCVPNSNYEQSYLPIWKDSAQRRGGRYQHLKNAPKRFCCLMNWIERIREFQKESGFQCPDFLSVTLLATPDWDGQWSAHAILCFQAAANASGVFHPARIPVDTHFPEAPGDVAHAPPAHEDRFDSAPPVNIGPAPPSGCAHAPSAGEASAPPVHVDPAPHVAVPPVPPVSIAPAPVFPDASAPPVRVATAPAIVVAPAPPVDIDPAVAVGVAPAPPVRIAPNPGVAVAPAPLVEDDPAPHVEVVPAPVLEDERTDEAADPPAHRTGEPLSRRSVRPRLSPIEVVDLENDVMLAKYLGVPVSAVAIPVPRKKMAVPIPTVQSTDNEAEPSRPIR